MSFHFLESFETLYDCLWREFLFYQWIIETNKQADVSVYCYEVKMLQVPMHRFLESVILDR